MAATTLEMFFIDGSPEGMLAVEVFGWTGHILVAPRTRLSDALKRKQSEFTGVYVLIGEDDDGPLAYIGEGDSVAVRIKSHDAKKDWWNKFVLITTSANNLHKAHVQYIEAKLVQLGNEAAHTRLENATAPALPSLPEAATANMEAFIDQLLMVLPALRVDLFTLRAKKDEKTPSKKKASGHTIPEFELKLKKEGIVANAFIENGAFVVKKGSMARSDWIGDRTDKTSYWKLYDALVAQGVLTSQGSVRVFSTDYAFSSTSAAGAVCNGRSTAGPVVWKVKGSTQTYKEWEAAQLA